MKRLLLRKLSQSIEKMMKIRKMAPKELAQASKIGYSSLIPILNGSRDCGVSKLVAIANALNCTTDVLLEGLIPISNDLPEDPSRRSSTAKPSYLVVFISLMSVTYCVVYEVDSHTKKNSVLQFALSCGLNAEDFLDRIVTTLQDIMTQQFKIPLDSKNFAVYASVQQYEWTENRRKIQEAGDNLFATFILESDALTNHRALFGTKNGILITINNGNSITYSTDKGKHIAKLQGYGFPISDVAGNYWIGCEALKYATNVKENAEFSSLLSDRIFALFNNDLCALSESIERNPEDTYTKISSIVKELILEDPHAYAIVKASADLLLKKIKQLDNQLKIKLPIGLTGDLANLYKQFFPKERVISFKEKQSTTLLNYGIDFLKKIIS